MKAKKTIGIDATSSEKECNDKKCPFHGNVTIRGRSFKGEVVSKDQNRTAIVEWTRRFYLKKYERFEKRKTRIKVHNAPCINANIKDNVEIIECRPLSKTKKFVIVKNLKNEST